jgi:hypothetical protein
MNRTLALGTGIALSVFLLETQLFPFRVDNPPVSQEPVWDSPKTKFLARGAIFDRHFSEVRVPWYGHVAPVGWLMRSHVREGGTYVDFSKMDRSQSATCTSREEIRDAQMSPGLYTKLHPTARPTPEELNTLVQGPDRTRNAF